MPAAPGHEAPASRGLVAFGLSECGPVRKGNEDAFTFDMGLGLFVVADGMGGHAAGEVASRLAVEAIYAFVARSESDPELTWPYAPEADLSMEANRLRNAVLLGNRRVFRAAECQSDYAGMGTTVVAALFGPNAVAIAHVGDSRIYSYVDGQLARLTEDDSLLASLKGSIDPAQHAKHPLRNVLTNVLGAREETEVHVADHPLAPGNAASVVLRRAALRRRRRADCDGARGGLHAAPRQRTTGRRRPRREGARQRDRARRGCRRDELTRASSSS